MDYFRRISFLISFLRRQLFQNCARFSRVTQKKSHDFFFSNELFFTPFVASNKKASQNSHKTLCAKKKDLEIACGRKNGFELVL